MTAMSRTECLSRLTAYLESIPTSHPLRVAVDGPDAAGKTTLCDDLSEILTRTVVRAGVDGFHRPRDLRRRRGSLSPEGYYLDAFDSEAVVASVLRPLGPGGDRWYVPATYDLHLEEAVDLPPRRAGTDAILLFDGVFLLRPELRDHWDVAIYLHVEPEETLRRALERDLELFGSAEVILERYRARYLPGQAIYRKDAAPQDRADILLDLTDPATPTVLRGPD